MSSIRRMTAASVLSMLVLVLAASACAADGDAPAKLALKDALAAALGGNANLQAAEKDYLAALSQTRVAGFNTSFTVGSAASLDRSPTDSTRSGRLFGGMTYKNLLGTIADLTVSPFASGTQEGSVNLAIRHPLMQKKGKLSDKSDTLLSARSDAAVREKDFFLRRQATVEDVISSYYRAVLAAKQAKVQEDALAVAQKTAEITAKREEAGLDTGLDAARAQASVAVTKDQLNTRQQAVRSSMDVLMVAIGKGVGQTPELVDDLPELAEEPVGLGDAVKRALDNRSELAQYDERITTQKRKLAIAEDELKPGLDIVTNFSSSASQNNALTSSLLREGFFSAGVEYRHPLDKRTSLERRDTETRELDTLNRLRTFEMEQIAEQVRRAYRDMETARTSLEIDTLNLKVDEDLLRLAERTVEEGQGTNRDVLDAQAALTQDRSGILAARTQLYLATIDLKYYMGEDLTKMVAK